MFGPAVSSLFVSLLALAPFTFPSGNYTDLEVSRDGTVWVLLEGVPELCAVFPSGESARYFLDDISRPSGLCLDGTGGMLVSDASDGTVTFFDRFVQPVAVTGVSGTPGDLVLAGMSVWYVDTQREAVLTTEGLVIKRDAPASGRLHFERGTGLFSGDGVYRIMEGGEPVLVSATGAGCLVGDSVLVLSDSVLYFAGGDTLLCQVRHTRVSASPGGGVVVLWGGGLPPLVVE